MNNPWICGGCGQQFGGLSTFDRHRVGKFTGEHTHYGRRCLTAEELRTLGYELRADIWRRPMPQDLIDKLKAMSDGK
jgi:hypothetical protein